MQQLDDLEREFLKSHPAPPDWWKRLVPALPDVPAPPIPRPEKLKGFLHRNYARAIDYSREHAVCSWLNYISLELILQPQDFGASMIAQHEARLQSLVSKTDLTLQALARDQLRRQDVLREILTREERELLLCYSQAYPQGQLTDAEREQLIEAERERDRRIEEHNRLVGAGWAGPSSSHPAPH